ncbi:MAG: hypothetical protein AB2604_01690 [Candidatus Thiodiazotropha taylori]
MKNTLLISIIILIFSPAVYSKDIVIWYKLDQPPYYTPNDTGIHNRIINHLISRLPEYQHKFRRSNIGRALNQIKVKETAVFVGMYKTQQRMEYSLYSRLPLYLNLNTTLIYKKSNSRNIEPFINQNGEVNIEALIQSEQFKLGISEGRQYSGIVDRMIEKYGQSGSFLIRSATNIPSGHLKMLLHERIDAYFDVPLSVEESITSSGADGDEIVLAPISGMKRYEPVWILFPLSKWGQNIANQIDNILYNGDTIDTYAGYYMKHIDASFIGSYKSIYKKYYQENYEIEFVANVGSITVN